MFDESIHAELVSQLASAIRSGAVCAVRTPGWATLLRLPAGLLDGDGNAGVRIGRCACRAAEDELVVLDLNLGAVAQRLFDMLASEIGPFIVGVGEVKAHLAPEGRIILHRGD